MTDEQPRMRAGTSARERAEAERRAAQRRKAIQRFMAERDLKPAEWARNAGLPNANAIYNLRTGASRSLSQETLERLARAAGASVAELIGEAAASERMVNMVSVAIDAESGAWRRSYEVGGARRPALPVPPGMPVDEAAMVADNHASTYYQAGMIVGVQSFGTLGRRGLIHGDRVLVHRVRERKHETTIRLVVEGGSAKNRSGELHFASRDRRFGAIVPVPTWPYDGSWWETDGDRFQIRGRVVLGYLLDDDGA
jgi:hypothetical protein